MTLTRRGSGWLLFGIALVLRAGWVLMRWAQQGAALEFPDEALHWELATNLMHGGALVSDDGRFAARMPLYPIFLAYFASFGEAGVLLARLAQCVLGAAVAAIAYRLTRKALDRRIGVIAGLLVAIDPFAIFFSNLLLTEVLFTVLAVSIIACAWFYLTGPRRVLSLFGLALFGPAVILTRPSAAGWIPLIWLLVWLAAIDRGRTFAQLLLCPVVLLLLLLPWGLRNEHVLGSPAWLSTNGGVTLYDAQGPQADGSSDQAFLERLEENPEFSAMSEVERDAALQERALDHMRTNPARVLRLAVVKLMRTWNPFPNFVDYRGSRAAWVGAMYTVGVIALALVGMARGLSRRLRPHQMTFWRLLPGPRTFQALLWLPVLYFTFVHCIYIGSVRYRVPLMPLLAIGAATAFIRPSTRLRSWHSAQADVLR